MKYIYERYNSFMHFKRLVFVYGIIVGLLSGCLPAEDPCDYYILAQKQLAQPHWKIDTFSVFVHDSTSLYHLDTFYTSYGEVQFVPDNMNSCKGTGSLLFTRTNGSVDTLRYDFQTEGPYPRNDFIHLSSAAGLDGYPAAYSRWSRFYRQGNIIQVTQLLHTVNDVSYIPVDNTNVLRYWNFTLSKK